MMLGCEKKIKRNNRKPEGDKIKDKTWRTEAKRPVSAPSSGA